MTFPLNFMSLILNFTSERFQLRCFFIFVTVWILTPIICVYVVVVMVYLLIQLPFRMAKWAFYHLLSLYDEDAYESYIAHQHLKGQAHDVDEDGYDLSLEFYTFVGVGFQGATLTKDRDLSF